MEQIQRAEEDGQGRSPNIEKVYKTEVTGIDGAQELGDTQGKAAKVQHYEVAQAKVIFEENSTVTDDNLGELKIQDYDAYFAEQF